MNPEVSVILPFYNAENTLAESINSILNQTYHNFELLLVDNGSTDRSPVIARLFLKNDSRIVLLNEKKRGVVFAMNSGLENVKGRFIARMDADDVSFPHRLEEQFQFLQENSDIHFVGSEVKYVSKEKNNTGFQRFVHWVNSFHSPEEIKLNRFVEIPVANPTIFFRRKVYEKFGGCMHGNFPEDYEMQLRYLQAGVKMAKLIKPHLEWHDYPTRLTRTDERYSTEAFFTIKARYFQMWSEKYNRYHPKIWVWGAGRKTRQRSKLLENAGLKIDGFIDIAESRFNSVYYKKIPGPGKIFIVSMVTNPGAREKIRKFLFGKNYDEGVDFILMG